MRAATIVREALMKPATERAAFLEQACGGDPGLFAEVASLLASHEQSSKSDEPVRIEETIDTDADEASAATNDYLPKKGWQSVDLESSESPESVERQAASLGKGAVIQDRYTLTKRLGEGGMGEVWAAQQVEPVKREVAVKLIRSGVGSTALLQRFEQERQALALMDHPNIAQVFDGGLTESGHAFLVMELVRGRPLTDYCDDARLSPRDRLQLFATICHAIQHAHHKGVIHRDLKPANILVAEMDGKPVPKVIDFGLAKAIEGKLTDNMMTTQFGAVIGTLEYMSPEQAGLSPSDIDTRADIYSLGVILYELLTGVRPLEVKRTSKSSLPQLIKQIQEEEPSKPSTRLSSEDGRAELASLRSSESGKLVAMLRGDLDWVILRCLEKQRDRRYETANGLARDIQRYLADEPVEARPPSRSYRLAKFVKRNRALVFAATAVALALVAGIVGTTIGLLKAQYQEGVALKESEAKDRALASEQEQRKLAQKHADLAGSVLDTMTSELTEKALLTQQDVTDDQKRFLTEALSYYRELARFQPDSEDGRQRVANAAMRVGVIEMRLNRKENSLAAYRSAADLFAQLATDFPDNFKHQELEAVNRHMAGQLLNDLNRKAEAGEQYRAALAIREELASAFPENAAYRQAVVTTRLNMSAVNDAKTAAATNDLDDVLAEQTRLAEEFPDKPEYRDVLAAGLANQALDLIRAGNTEEAIVRGHKALAIQEKLVQEHPEVRDYRQRLYRTHQYLAAAHSARQESAKLMTHYREAMAIQLKLVEDYPAVPQYRQELAVTRVNLGSQLFNEQKIQAGEEQLREASNLLEKLASELPKEMMYRQQLVTTQLNLSIILDATGRPQEGEEMLGKALVHFEVLAKASPAASGIQRDFISRCLGFAKRLRDGGKLADSVPWLSKAVALAAALHQETPDDTAIKQQLHESLAARAAAHSEMERFREALPDWDQALETSSTEKRTSIRLARALARAKAGNASDAVKELNDLEEADDLDGEQYFGLARIYALAAAESSQPEGDSAKRSNELLRAAIEHGFKDAARLKSEKAFDVTRGGDEFKGLLDQLEGR